MGGALVRLAMLGTHYRQPIDWTAERLHRAAAMSSIGIGVSRSKAVDCESECSVRQSEQTSFTAA